jgi:CHAD domain-containing protein
MTGGHQHTSRRRIGVAAFARAQVKARLQVFLDAAAHAAKHPDEPEAVHDLRVSIRRLTQCLRTFRRLFHRGPLQKVRRRLHKLMRLCAAVRTCDVALELLAHAGITQGSSTSRLAHARTEARQTLHKYIKKQRLHKSSHWKLQWRAGPRSHREWDLKQTLESNLGRLLPDMAVDFFGAGAMAAAAGHPRQLHPFRLHTKHFRYTLEIFQEFYARDFSKAIDPLRGLQDRLGAINDCVATLSLLDGDRRARTAVTKLLRQREKDFHTYWEARFAPKSLVWWREWLSAPRANPDADAAG